MSALGLRFSKRRRYFFVIVIEEEQQPDEVTPQVPGEADDASVLHTGGDVGGENPDTAAAALEGLAEA